MFEATNGSIEPPGFFLSICLVIQLGVCFVGGCRVKNREIFEEQFWEPRNHNGE